MPDDARVMIPNEAALYAHLNSGVAAGGWGILIALPYRFVGSTQGATLQVRPMDVVLGRRDPIPESVNGRWKRYWSMGCSSAPAAEAMGYPQMKMISQTCLPAGR